MKLEFYPDFDLKVVDVDNNIESKLFDDGVLLTFVGKEDGVFFPYEKGGNTMPNPMVGVLEDESMPLVKYIVEKYKLLTLAIDGFSNVTSRLAGFIFSEDELVYDAVVEDYATLEMLAFAEEYGWSAEFMAHLEARRKASRERLGVKDCYALGDVVKLDFCDDEKIGVRYGKVIYVDKLHAIVHLTADSIQQMSLNRNCIPHDVVSNIIGQPIETVIEHDYDKFIDMMDAYSYLATDPHSPGTWINPNNIYE